MSQKFSMVTLLKTYHSVQTYTPAWPQSTNNALLHSLLIVPQPIHNALPPPDGQIPIYIYIYNRGDPYLFLNFFQFFSSFFPFIFFGWFMENGHMATNLDLAGETRSANEHGTGKGLRDGNVMEQRRTNPKKKLPERSNGDSGYL